MPHAWPYAILVSIWDVDRARAMAPTRVSVNRRIHLNRHRPFTPDDNPLRIQPLAPGTESAERRNMLGIKIAMSLVRYICNAAIPGFTADAI